MKVPPEITLFEGNGTLFGYFRVLHQALRARSYDVVHAHTPHVAIAFLLVAWWCRRGLLRRTVFTVHNCFENHKLRNRLMLWPVFVFFRRVVCCSRSCFESFPRFYRWLAGKRFCCVQNGVNIKRIEEARRTLDGRDDATFTVAAIGRMVAIKNLSATMRAFERIGAPDSRLMFVGDGPQRDLLVRERNELGLKDSVQFTGAVERDEVYRRMLHSDLYVSTSYGEGLPVAVLEAMACGCPVVLSDIAPHREIADGVDFIPLVSPDDLGGFAREIDRFKQMSAVQREQIGRGCKQLVRDRFSLEAMHTGYGRVYEQVMSGSRESLTC